MSKEPHPAVEAMQYAVNEIEGLRRENEILRAKVGVMELFGQLILPQRHGGCVSPDVMHLLRRAIHDMTTQPESP